MGGDEANVKCIKSKPISSKNCNIHECEFFNWKTSDWGECSLECGQGTHSRTVKCISSITGDVDDSKCGDINTKPPIERKL